MATELRAVSGRTHAWLVALLVTGTASACTQTAKPEVVPEIKPGLLQGYLPRGAVPDSLALVPPPPAEGSTAMEMDETVAQNAQTLSGSPRWAVATEDADLGFPAAAATFECALGIRIDATSTPALYMLLRRTLTDAGLSTYGAKDHYQRTRPFVAHSQPSCRPRDEAMLRKDGSYPSGHSAVGWAWALVLTELAPERADALLARGRAFGQSRVVCNAHWQSDVIEGRNVGAAAVARLHAEAAFQDGLKAARADIVRARAQGRRPSRDCAAEALALRAVAEDAPWPANR